MNEEMFREWLESPVTERVFKYLLDSVQAEAEYISETIISGSLVDEEYQRRVAADSIATRKLIEISNKEIEGFYSDRTTDKQNNHQA